MSRESDETDTAEATQRRPRDNRRIISGVQVMTAGNLRTYSADTEAECDALDEVLTAEQVERLKKIGAIEGDWSGKAEEAPPMKGSRALRVEGHEGTAAQIQALQVENARLQRQLAEAGVAAEDTPPEGEAEASGEGHEHKHRRGRRSH